MSPEGHSVAFNEAGKHARLDLPVPKGSRHRPWKRAIAKLNWFFLHHQVAYNTEVLTTLDTDVLSSTGLAGQIEVQAGQIQIQASQIQIQASQIEAQANQIDALGAQVWAAIAAQTSQIDALSAEVWAAIAAQTSQLDMLSTQLWSAIETQTKHVDAVSAELWAAIETQTKHVDAVSAELWAAIETQTKHVDAVSAQLWAAVETQTGQIDTLSADVWAAINNVGELLEEHKIASELQVDLVQRQAFARHHEGISELRQELVEMALQIGEIHTKLDTGAASLRRRQSAVDALLNEMRRSLPEPPSPETLGKLPGPMDAMYPDFEDAFRGSPAHVTELVKEYLPDVLGLDRHGPVVDLGSGRGEWLQVLRDAGVEAYGVDLNEEFVEQCQSRGLKVVAGDALEHLSAVSERSLSAITAFHLVEHVPIDRVIQLIDLSVRALRPGGLFILETPNPDNLVVGASNFYLDPGHLRPLPPGLLAFLVEARGFADVETRFLHPNAGNCLRYPKGTEPWAGDLAPLVEAINSRLYGAQDYAVIGRRL
jgi:SAM-dependent methyltransferase/acyl-CoA thioesterase FadM